MFETAFHHLFTSRSNAREKEKKSCKKLTTVTEGRKQHREWPGGITGISPAPVLFATPGVSDRETR